ncbi:MAG: DUF72 domain-containing protein [Thermomicrobiales bacterium]
MTGRSVPRADIRIGISSWGSLPGFYPAGIKSADKLPWYARFFTLVEVNTSYYAVIPTRNYDRWAEATPDGFLFDVKAFSELSSARMMPDPSTFAAFRDSAQPLRDAGKMGAVLFQFSPSFTNTPRSREHLARIAAEMSGEIAVIEFRNYSWLSPETADETLDLLKKLGLAYAIADEPQIPRDTVPPLVAVTNPNLAYIRLHGRNAAGWYGGRGDRYDYDYSAEEIAEWAATAKRLARDATEVHVLFNNNARGDGTRNAITLGELLGVSPAETPELPPAQPPLFADGSPE